jgi:ubiquinone/menaquinone biosynthesis C-methylase UbiE
VGDLRCRIKIMALIKRTIKLCTGAMLGRFGYEIRRKDAHEGLYPPGNGLYRYVAEAKRIGMDVNDWEEQELRWDEALPILERTTFPYLRNDSVVCNLGVGTGRWARHIAPRLTKGEFHLVDHDPWIVNFVREYFQTNERVFVHLNNGHSLPWPNGAWIDLVFSGGTFIALNLSLFYLYSREFFRVLKPGAYCVIEYIDVTTPEGWSFLESQSEQHRDCYTYYTPEVIDRVFSCAAFEIVKRHYIGRSTYLVVRKPDTAVHNGA